MWRREGRSRSCTSARCYTAIFVVFRAEGGELFDRVVEATKFSEELSKFYFYQMSVAIKVSNSLLLPSCCGRPYILPSLILLISLSSSPSPSLCVLIFSCTPYPPSPSTSLGLLYLSRPSSPPTLSLLSPVPHPPSLTFPSFSYLSSL